MTGVRGEEKVGPWAYRGFSSSPPQSASSDHSACLVDRARAEAGPVVSPCNMPPYETILDGIEDVWAAELPVGVAEEAVGGRS